MDTYKDSDCSAFAIKYNTDYNTKDLDMDTKVHKAIFVIQMKLEGELVHRRPEFEMTDRALLEHIDYDKGTVTIDGKEYELKDTDFPTIKKDAPNRLSPEEIELMERLAASFVNSEKLQKHVRFLYSKGSLYKVFNSNLLYHGCVPLNEDGSFMSMKVGGKEYTGKALYDMLEANARKGFYKNSDPAERALGQDYTWYLWAGPKSPAFGKDRMTTFERQLIDDPETHVEKKNAYYRLRDNEEIVDRILAEFGLDSRHSHIINGHVPVELKKGESPVLCGGKLFIIDGGFSKAYQSKTGIAGYTLVSNSHGVRLVQHEPFTSARDAIINETDIVSDSEIVEMRNRRILVADTDTGRMLKEQIKDLEELLRAYEEGTLHENAKG